MLQFMLFEGSEAGFLLENVESIAFSLFSKKVEKSMPKVISKAIVDAERHRRTPWTLAVESKAIESKKSADIGGTGAEKEEKNMPKPFKYRQNGSQNPSKIREKSRLRRGCVFGAFWGGTWSPKCLTVLRARARFGSHFRSKCTKNEIFENIRVLGGSLERSKAVFF